MLRLLGGSLTENLLRVRCSVAFSVVIMVACNSMCDCTELVLVLGV